METDLTTESRALLPMVDLCFAAVDVDFLSPFDGFGWFVRVSLSLLALVIPAILVLVLYRYEAQLVRPLIALGLLALRLAAVGLIWLLLFCRPVVTFTHTEPIPGKVLVAVDHSGSTDIADPQRSPVDRLKLAFALRKAEDLARPAELRDWINDLEAGHTDSLDSERRLRVEAVTNRMAKVTRREIAVGLLLPDGADLLTRLRDRHMVEAIGFGSDVSELSEDIETLRAEILADAPGGEYTDLRPPLAKANADSENLLGVVLLTDGQHNWGDPPIALASELGKKGVPIFPVMLGPEEAPADVALVSAQVPPSVFRYAEATVEARVRIRNQPPGKVRVTLTRSEDDPDPLVEEIDHDGTDHTHTVRFRPAMDEPGTAVITLKAEPGPGLTDEHPENNVRQVSTLVAPEQARVLLVDDTAGWEYHYLSTALARDRTMKLDGVLFRQPRLGEIPEQKLLEMGYPSRSLPGGKDALADYDCIILSDVPAAHFTDDQLANLERLVADAGKTLVIVAGKRSMPMSYLRGGASNPMTSLLPVRDVKPIASKKGFAFTLTDEGKRTAFLQMEPLLPDSLARWESMPPQFWAATGPAKSGAEVLAYMPPTDEFGSAPDTDEWQRQHGLVVRQNYGFGRVLYVGIGSTWRWRFKVGDTYHHRFWGQVIRWAAERPLVAGTELIRFGTRQPVYQQSEPVDLIVRLNPSLPTPEPGSLMGARLTRLDEEGQPDEEVALVPLDVSDGRPRELQGQMSGLPPGEYAMELVLPDMEARVAALTGGEEDPLKMKAIFRVLPTDNAEMAELAADWDLMRVLASRSQGKVYAPHEATELIDRLIAKSASKQVTEVVKLWQSWLTLIVFVLLVGVEWTLRKWVGLA